MNLGRCITLVSKIKFRPLYKHNGIKLGFLRQVSSNVTENSPTKKSLKSLLSNGPSLQDFIKNEEESVCFQQSGDDLPYASVQHSQNFNRKGKRKVCISKIKYICKMTK